MERTPLTAKICILTETQAGEKYLLKANSFNEVANDWHGTRDFVPEADAKVYFATLEGEPINPYAYKDFSTLMSYIREKLFFKGL